MYTYIAINNLLYMCIVICVDSFRADSYRILNCCAIPCHFFPLAAYAGLRLCVLPHLLGMSLIPLRLMCRLSRCHTMVRMYMCNFYSKLLDSLALIILLLLPKYNLSRSWGSCFVDIFTGNEVTVEMPRNTWCFQWDSQESYICHK